MMSARLGFGLLASSAAAEIRMPGQAIAALAGLLVEQRLLQRMQPRRRRTSPSTVVTVLPATVATSREQEYSGLPSISTMQAPHCSVPQPNLLPRRSSSSRSTESSGVVPSMLT